MRNIDGSCSLSYSRMQLHPMSKNKMIQFSYGLIGVIQALAGFFTYMIVLNDYGYPPSTLINRGHSEVWGHQPLFCKFKGGNYVNLTGDINEALNPSGIMVLMARSFL